MTDLKEKLSIMEAENKTLLKANARLQGGNDALATMLKDERGALQDRQEKNIRL